MITLYGRTTSINVQKVMWCLAEVGCPYERVDVGGEFGKARADYLALNPNGTVPTLVDGDTVVWESNSIIRHLADVHGGDPWYPRDARRRAMANQWMDWTLGVLNPRLRIVYVAFVQSPKQRAERVPLARPFEFHPDAAKAAFEHAGEIWSRLDAHLALQPYVAGDTPTMGDIPPGAWLHRWYKVPGERPNLPHLEAWYRRLLDRPAYRQNIVEMPL